MSRLSRRHFLYLAAGAVSIGGCSEVSPVAITSRGFEPDPQSELQPIHYTGWALGSNISIQVLHRSKPAGKSAVDAAIRELDLVEELMSLYRPHSQICQLNRTGTLLSPHPHVLSVLELAQSLAKQTDGAFDITVQPLWNLYSTAQKVGSLPDETAIQRVRSSIGWQKLKIASDRISLTEPGMAITLNGIAQGFAADRVAAVLKEHGVEHALIDTGEINAVGRKEGDASWTAGIQHPRQADAYVALAQLAGRCLATSGDYSTSFSEDYRHHHIFDPRTGRSPEALSSVSIVAPSSTMADALSTTAFVLGIDDAMSFIRSQEDTEALFVLKSGETIATARFPFQQPTLTGEAA